MATAKIVPVGPDDLPACFSVINAAFQQDAPFINLFYPAHGTPAGDAQAVSRFNKMLEKSSNSTFIAAVAGDKIVGFAIWTLMHKPPSDDLAEVLDPDEVWPGKPDVQRFAKQIWKEFVQPRAGVVREWMEKGKATNVLEYLAVHPDAQRQGVGAKLVKYGTDYADSNGIGAIVEATPVGLYVYKKCGFKVTIESMRFDVDQEFSDWIKPDLIFLRRDPVS